MPPGQRRRLFEDGPPYDVRRYKDLDNKDGNAYYLDSNRFAALLTYMDPEKNTSGYTPRLDADMVWSSRWLHMGGRMPGGMHALTQGPFDMPYVRCSEELWYTRRLQNYIAKVKQSPIFAVSSTVNDKILIPGKFEYVYLFNRSFWGKDHSDESRLREEQHVFWGWHNMEFFDMAHADRERYYLKLTTEWQTRFWTPRVLAVPSPWVFMYTQNLLLDKHDVLSRELHKIGKLEYSLFTVLSIIQAASEGVYKNANYSKDPRFHGEGIKCTWQQRLAALPAGVIEILAVVHPFYFLESLSSDPALGFLALRRAQEVSIDGDMCQYDWGSGTFDGFDVYTFINDNGNTVTLPPITASRRVEQLTGIPECNMAYKRFKELTDGHKGNCARVQILREVTEVLNDEGFGIESAPLTTMRMVMTTAGQSWRATCTKYSPAVQARLDSFKTQVALLPEEPEDGGIDNYSRAVIEHPPQTKVVPMSEIEETRPHLDWWPKDESYMAVKNLVDTVAVICNDWNMPVPTTIQSALQSTIVFANKGLEQVIEDKTKEKEIETLKGKVRELQRERDNLKKDNEQATLALRNAQDTANIEKANAKKMAQYKERVTRAEQTVTIRDAQLKTLQKKLDNEKSVREQTVKSVQNMIDGETTQMQELRELVQKHKSDLEGGGPTDDAQSEARLDRMERARTELETNFKENMKSMLGVVQKAKEDMDTAPTLKAMELMEDHKKKFDKLLTDVNQYKERVNQLQSRVSEHEIKSQQLRDENKKLKAREKKMLANIKFSLSQWEEDDEEDKDNGEDKGDSSEGVKTRSQRKRPRSTRS